MRVEDAAAVRGLALFRSLEDAAFADLLETAYLQRFPPGIVLISENERADFLHVVMEGTVEMFATSAGRETTIELIRPVGLFILAAVLNDQVYLQSARTLTKAQVLLIPAEKVRMAMERQPAFMRAIVMELASDYRRTIRDLKGLKLRSSAERLANWLLRADTEQGGSGRIELPCEKRTLAARLGMTPENLSRAFAALSAYGVETKGGTVLLTTPPALARFASPDPLIDQPDPGLAPEASAVPPGSGPPRG
ncbi:transcriptional activator [Azorhizobium caulinodans ORS 571]|uniref:Transcriptional activator n=1 Tax=Azorhizobium caulinodans (strain ATCC 43989 / DSM 5975 / JCM 20966 / LMG 6465 / NBRC 14845 / NCIMB 13405 / ORS 571) TaxID=438753 RepID=A8I1V4_AZOC5|nr:cyclic nucleotide-binding domain-containing protein [Azorhizobium caulinodans]BAF87421.1 transcriptional activator [Azorhizobium caulinodans ORS 571]